MARRRVNIRGTDGEEFTAGMAVIASQFDVPQVFPPAVLAAAEETARHPKLPGVDRTDLPLVTLDPAGSQDLDQAFHIERYGGGFRLYYAIADVAAFVMPDGPVDVEAHRRGETLYAPDHRVPLHPVVLSEGAASLLPNQPRPALLWQVTLDPTGEAGKVEVHRALVRSRAQFDYESIQREIDANTAPPVFALLQEVGTLRLQREQERGGISLPLPEQEVVVDHGDWSLRYRTSLPLEQWNAEMSLLIGTGCAQIMLYGEVGILRTLPPAPDSAVHRLRRTARALHLTWDPDEEYPDFVRALDPNTPAGAAMLNACTTLLRGAGYVAFDGGVPENVEHAALATEYAHCTAPLRRLVDRYAGEVAIALCEDRPVPEWVLTKLRALPKEMEEANQRAHQFDGAVLSLVEAGMLSDRIGESFPGVIIEVEPGEDAKGTVMLSDPAVEAGVTAAGETLPLGEEVTVRLVEADTATRVVRFELAESAGAG
ncbi:MAG: RNB domain-containing ribonuclease [Sciscionella sp.]